MCVCVCVCEICFSVVCLACLDQLLIFSYFRIRGSRRFCVSLLLPLNDAVCIHPSPAVPLKTRKNKPLHPSCCYPSNALKTAYLKRLMDGGLSKTSTWPLANKIPLFPTYTFHWNIRFRSYIGQTANNAEGPGVALRYKSVGPGIDPKRWRLEFILWQLTFPCALGSFQPLKFITRIFLGVKAAGA